MHSKTLLSEVAEPRQRSETLVGAASNPEYVCFTCTIETNEADLRLKWLCHVFELIWANLAAPSGHAQWKRTTAIDAMRSVTGTLSEHVL